MSKLHCYRTDDGARYSYVAATNMKEAAKLLRISVDYMRTYGGGRVPDDDPESVIVRSYPNVVFKRKMSYVGARPPQLSPAWIFDAGGRLGKPSLSWLAEFDAKHPEVPEWADKVRDIYRAGEWTSIDEFLGDIRRQLV